MKDRDLVRLYWPVELRPAYDVLFAIDDALADVVATSTQPALGAIRLAWWREALERLDVSPPPPEPRLQAAAAELLTRGVTGAMLAGLEDGWATLLDEQPDWDRATQRGQKLFSIAALLLGDSDPLLGTAGRLFAGIDLARRGHLELDRGRIGLERHRFPRRLRPLTSFAALASRDLARGEAPFEPEATPGRAAALLSHRLFGLVV